MNKSQENWPDVQLSLSTAIPSLGGAPPKLATLKIDYEKPSYNRRGLSPGVEFFKEATLCKSTRFAVPRRMLASTSLNSSTLSEEDEEQSLSTINVLAAQTEASMSSTSFAIPRKSTIDADVS